MPTPLANKIFLGPNGLRAGWRLLLFLMVAGVLNALTNVIFGLAVHRWWHPNEIVRAIDDGLACAGIFAATWIVSRMDRAPLERAYLGSRNRGRNLFAGAISGFTVLSLLLGAITLAGGYRPGPALLHGPDIAIWGAFWAMQFCFTGLLEEMLTRGYPLSALTDGIGFWPAAALLSILFGAGHLGNTGEQTIGIVNAMLVGMAFAFSVKWSGSLWWAIGCHAAWDWAESFFYGVADSGILVSHHLYSGKPQGPGWLSGGAVGPEGSLLAIGAIALIVVAAWLTSPRAPIPPAALEPEPLVVSDGAFGEFPENG